MDLYAPMILRKTFQSYMILKFKCHSADHNSYKLCLIRLRNGFGTHCVVHNCISVTSDKRLRIALNLGEQAIFEMFRKKVQGLFLLFLAFHIEVRYLLLINCPYKSTNWQLFLL